MKPRLYHTVVHSFARLLLFTTCRSHTRIDERNLPHDKHVSIYSPLTLIDKCILKAHSYSHSKIGGLICASLGCQYCIWINSWRVSSHIVRYATLTLQLFKSSTDTQAKCEDQIEPPIFECEWAFRIQEYVLSNGLSQSTLCWKSWGSSGFPSFPHLQRTLTRWVRISTVKKVISQLL
jgi:hypothetical protein